MKPQALTDAGVGRALFTTRFRLSLQAVLMCLSVGAIPAFILPYALWFCIASPSSVDLVRLDMMSHVGGQTTPRRWRVSDAKGDRRVVQVELKDGRFFDLIAPQDIRTVLAAPIDKAENVFLMVKLASLLTAGLAYYVAMNGLRRLGAGSQENQRVRGASTVVPGPELDRLVKQQGGGTYKLVDVALPRTAPMTGILVLGSQGSGKSLAIHDVMRQTFDRKKKCIIYCHSGEFFEAYFRPGKDVFFNPACIGSVPWSIFSELKYSYDADTLARAFLPPKSGVSTGAGAFFEDAARALFSVILARLAERGARNTRDIATAFLEMPDDEMDLLIAQSVASSAVGGDSKGQRQGVISSIAIYLNGIKAVQPGEWSIRDFLAAPEDTRFFIVGSDDTSAQFAPLYRLLLTVAFGAIAAQQKRVHEDKYWFFLDECHTLGDIRLDEHLATLRKYGVCIVSGIQADSQFVSSMGKDRAATVSNCFNTVLLLRASEPDMQERAALRLAKVEMDTVSRNQALAVTEWRDGAGLNKTEHEKWLVMPAEFGELDPCQGWLKMAGSFPAARVDYSSWLTSQDGKPAHVERFRPVVPRPQRDPRFELLRSEGDAFKSIRDEHARLKAAANGEAAATTAAPIPAPVPPATPAAPAAPIEKRLGSLEAAPHGSTPAGAAAPAPTVATRATNDEAPPPEVDTVKESELRPVLDAGTVVVANAEPVPTQQAPQEQQHAGEKLFKQLLPGQTLGLDLGPQ